MGNLAGGPFRLNFHGIIRLLAILLMLVHAFWATVVIIGKKDKALKSFHRPYDGPIGMP